MCFASTVAFSPISYKLGEIPLYFVEPPSMETTHRPSPSYSLTLRIEYPNRVKTLGSVTSIIGEQGGDIGAVDIVKTSRESITRDITFSAADYEHGQRIIQSVRGVADVDIVNVSDRT